MNAAPAPWGREAQIRPSSVLASVPQNVTFDTDNTSITLNWLAPAVDGGSAITGYLLLYKSGVAPYPTVSGSGGGTNCAGRNQCPCFWLRVAEWLNAYFQ